MRNGGVGCISATANVNAAAIHRVFENWRSPEADAMQQGISATRLIVQKYPVIPALKAIVARALSDPDWITVRPPLVELTAAQRESLAADLDAHGYRRRPVLKELKMACADRFGSRGTHVRDTFRRRSAPGSPLPRGRGRS